jgi:transposase InsO family protein
MIYFVGVRSPCRSTGLARQFQLAMRPALPFSPAPKQAPVRKRIREIAKTWMRYRDRRIHVLLRRDGLACKHQTRAQASAGSGEIRVHTCPARGPLQLSLPFLFKILVW